MAGSLKMYERHDLYHIAYSQRISSRVKTDIAGYHFLVQKLFGAGHNVVKHAPPAELIHKFFHFLIL